MKIPFRLLFCLLLPCFLPSCSLPLLQNLGGKDRAQADFDRAERRLASGQNTYNAAKLGNYFMLVPSGAPLSPLPSYEQIPTGGPVYTAPPLLTAANHSVRTVRTTAYCHEEDDHLVYGKMSAQGTPLKFGSVRSAAADWSRYPLGTLFRITGQPEVVYQVDDYGSALVGTDTIDLYKPTLDQMNNWGVRHVDIEVIRWGSFHRSMQLIKDRTQFPHVQRMFDTLQQRVSLPATLPGLMTAML